MSRWHALLGFVVVLGFVSPAGAVGAGAAPDAGPAPSAVDPTAPAESLETSLAAAAADPNGSSAVGERPSSAAARLLTVDTATATNATPAATRVAAGATAATDDDPAEVTYVYRPLPNRTDRIAVDVEYRLPETVYSVELSPDEFDGVVTDTGAFTETADGTLVWDGGSRNRRIRATETSITIQVRAPDEDEVHLGDDWQFIGTATADLRGIRASHDWVVSGDGRRRGYYGGYPSEFDVATTAVGGAVGTYFVYFGEYEQYTREGRDERVTLVVPESAELRETPAAILDSLALQSELLRVGGRTDKITAFAAPDPIRSGGRASWTSEEFWVSDGSSLPGNVWGHEYVHTRQDRYHEESASWLVEAEAEYYQHFLAYEQGAFGAENDTRAFRRFEGKLGVDSAHEDVVLTDPETWIDPDRGPGSNYKKGARVLAALDAEIRNRTDGEETYEDVMAELNRQQRIDHGDFVDALETVTGEPMTDFVDSYVAGTEIPPAPDDPALFEDPATTLSVDRPGHEHGTQVRLETRLAGANDSQTTYRWDLTGNGDPDAITESSELEHEFETGTRTVTVQAITDDGRIGVAALEVVTSDTPSLELEERVVAIADEPLSIDAAVNNEIGDTTVTWAFPNETLEGTSIAHEDPPIGSYEVAVTASDEYGATTVERLAVVVTDVPRLTVDRPDPVPADGPISLAADVDNEVGNYTVTWRFSDGSTETGDRIDYNPLADRTGVTVVVEDEYGAERRETITLYRSGGSTTAGTSGDGVPGFGVPESVLAGVGLCVLLGIRRRFA